ncbi:MAG: hypothetical protein ACN6PL_15835, partial [Pseudomonas putida]
MTPGSFMRGVLSIDRRWQVVAFVSPDRSSAARAAHREQARSYIFFGPIIPVGFARECLGCGSISRRADKAVARACHRPYWHETN